MARRASASRWSALAASTGYHLTLEQAREGSADRTFEAPLEALQHTHGTSLLATTVPTMVSAPGIPHVPRGGTTGPALAPGDEIRGMVFTVEPHVRPLRDWACSTSPTRTAPRDEETRAGLTGG